MDLSTVMSSNNLNMITATININGQSNMENKSDTKNKFNHQYVIPIGIFAIILTLYLSAIFIQYNFVSGLNEEVRENNFVKQDIKANELNVQNTIGDHTKGQINAFETCLKKKEKYVRKDEKALTTKSKRQKINMDNNLIKKYNLSTRSKYVKISKRKQGTVKNVKSAEPIIYLFALIFIYLLLKAASDINEYYKTQNKNEKCIRRCSLQSYAQTHRMDRRTSKENILKHKLRHQHQYISPLRSMSFDPCYIAAKYIELQHPVNIHSAPHMWQFLNHCLTDLTPSTKQISTQPLSQEMRKEHRRHTIPGHLIAKSYADITDLLGTDIKQRRVRMINRH